MIKIQGLKVCALLIMASWTSFGQSIQLLMGSGSATSVVAVPTDSPGTGSYSGSQAATLHCSTSGCVICTTIDGSAPAAATAGTCSNGSTHVDGDVLTAFTINTTLKLLGTKVGLTNSAISGGGSGSVYTITGGGSITLVDHKSGSSSGGGTGAVATSAAANCTGASGGGVLVWSAFSDPTTDITVTDQIGGVASGNTWTGVSPTATTSFSVLFSKFYTVTAGFHFGANQTFIATPLGASLVSVAGFCFTPVTQLDNASAVNNTTGAGSSSACTTGSATTTLSPGLFMTSLTDNAGVGDVITAPTSYTLLEDVKSVGGSHVGGGLAWFSSGSTQTPTWTYVSGSQNVCQTISIK